MNKIQNLNKRVTTFFGLVLMLCLLLGLFPAAVSAAEDTFDPENESYVISTAADLNAFRSSITGTTTYEGVVVTLANDIDVSGTAWDTVDTAVEFCGTFDGQGFTISGFDDTACGLLYDIGASGKVSNLNMNFDIQSGSVRGGFAHYVYGTIESCSMSGTVVSSSSVGGLGYQICSGGCIKNCYSSADVSYSGTSRSGGMVRTITSGGTIENCYVTGDLDFSTLYAIGCLKSGGTATNCYYLDSINVTETDGGGTAKTADELKSQDTYTDWDFDTIWQIDASVNDGYPTLQQSSEATAKQTVELKAIVTVEDKVVPDDVTLEDLKSASYSAYLTPDFTVELVPVDESFDESVIATYNVSLEMKDPDSYTADGFFTGQEVENMEVDDTKINILIGNTEFQLVYDVNDLYSFEVFADTGFLLSYEANTPSFTFNGDTEVPTDEEKAEILATTKASIESQLAEYIPEGGQPTALDSWLIFTAARADYDFDMDDCYQLYVDKYENATSFKADDTAKDVLAITAMGYDARDVGGYDLINIMDNSSGTSWFTEQVKNFAKNSYNYGEDDWDADYIHELAAAAMSGESGENGEGDVTQGIDMYIMQYQPLAAYYDPDALEGDEFYDVKEAMEEVFFPYFSEMQGYTGNFYSGVVYANPWSAAQAHIMLGMSGTDIFDSMYIKNGFTLLSDLNGNTGYSADVGQCARGYEAMVRAAEGRNQIFDCTDVVNSTVPVNNAIAELPDADSITEDTKAAAQEKLDAVDTLLETLTLSEIQLASIDMADYDAVSAALNGEESDQDKADAVTAKIAALPETDSLTLSDETAVEEARTAYDALTDDQKALVSNDSVTTLEAAEAKIAELSAGEGDTDQDAADAVTALIAVLPETASITLFDETAVAAARTAYEGLSDDQKALVSEDTVAALEAAEAKITELEEAAESNQAVADAVTTQIAALPETASLTLEDETAVAAARTAYDVLTDTQKALVENVALLEAAEAQIAELTAAIPTVTFDVERFTLGQGFFIEPVTMTFDKGDTVYDLLEQAVGAENIVGSSSYVTGIKGSDTGTVSIPDYIVSVLGGGDTDTAVAYGNSLSDSALGSGSYSAEAGWMYLVNNESPSDVMGEHQLVDGDVVRIAFSYCCYGADLTGWGYDENWSLVQQMAIGDRDALLQAIAAVNSADNRDSLLENAAVTSAYDNAFTVAADMTKTSAEIQAAADALNEAVSNANSQLEDQDAADAVTTQIAALPEAESLTLSDETAVTAARSAYEVLTADQQALVATDFVTILEAAEAKITELKEAQGNSDQDAADAVTTQIAALPEADSLTLSDETAVAAARSAYEALTDTQKSLVGTDSFTTLEAVEAKIAELKEAQAIDQAAADPVTALINALPATSSLKLSDRSDVKSARSAYDSLTADQQALVTNYETLTAAEAKIKKLADANSNGGSDGGSDSGGSSDTGDEDTGDDDTDEEPPVVIDEESGIEMTGFDEGVGLVVGEQGDKAVEKAAQEAAEEKGLTNDSIITIYDIKPDLSEEELEAFNNDPDSKATLTMPIPEDELGMDSYMIYHLKENGEVEWITPVVSEDGKTVSFEVSSFSIFALLAENEDESEPNEESKEAPVVSYQTHVQNVGWQDAVTDGALSGTEGQGLRLEGIKIDIDSGDYDLGVSYATHVENIGWQDAVIDDALSGTEGQGLRLEGITISLTGQDADLFDIYYQVHAQNIGWMGWAKNGEEAGTEGLWDRLEGIHIVVVEKGAEAPGSTDGAFLSGN